MRNIEKSLINFVEGKGPKVSKETLYNCALKDTNAADEIIGIIFNVINREIDNVTGITSLDNLKVLVDYITMIMGNSDAVNRKIVMRKIQKLEEKIDRIEIENKNKFVDKKKALNELEKVRKKIEQLHDDTEKKDTKQYDFIDYLVNSIKDISYIEYTFKKMPALVNVKDKEDLSLFHNLLLKYINGIKENIEEDILYYGNLISLVLSKKEFEIKEKEKRKYLEILYCEIDKMSIGKKNRKINCERISKLKDIIDIIQGAEEKSKEIDIIANKYNIKVFFDEELIENAKLVKEEKTGTITDRVALDDFIITIDGENALEIDDGLSCKLLPNGNYLLGVHIASILGYLPYESDLVQEAISRNRSIYLPKKYQINENETSRVIPIFPYNFAAVRASIIEGENRLARSYFFEIDKKGNIVNEEFKKTIIKSGKRTTFEEIDDILANGTDNEKLQTLIDNLQGVTKILENRHKATNIYEKIKENIEDISDLRYGQIGSEKIIYQTMLLTGNRVAEFFARNSYPCLYRVHEVNEKNITKLEAMVKNLNKTYGGGEYKKLYELISGIYPNGWYDTKGSHYGLSLDHYCHCTSGLRRAADIIVEHCLEVCYDKTPTEEELLELEQELERRKLEINAKESSIEWFIKDYKRTYQKRRH